MGDFLCQLIERPMPQVRLLGRSELVTITNNHCVVANGNNATIGRVVAAGLEQHVQQDDAGG